MKCFSYIRFFSSFLYQNPRTLWLLLPLLMLMGAAGKYSELKENAKRKITMQNQYYNLIRSHFLHWNISISSPILAPFTSLMLSICLELFPLRFRYFSQHYISLFFLAVWSLKMVLMKNYFVLLQILIKVFSTLNIFISCIASTVTLTFLPMEPATAPTFPRK